ncbi:hypothetical protein [Vibrio phage vB_VmeM-Yong MS32]|nr:hypothetical protein [Vibrio phage vB_VmeM-Yong MS32]
MSVDDLTCLAKLRKEFFRSVDLTRWSQVQMMKQLLRESTGKMRLSPTHLLTMDNRLLNIVEREKAEKEIRDEYYRQFALRVNRPNEVLDKLLPLNSQCDFMRCIEYMYCFISAAQKLHVVKEDAPPPN